MAERTSATFGEATERFSRLAGTLQGVGYAAYSQSTSVDEWRTQARTVVTLFPSLLALEWLQKAINLGNDNYLWFESDPNWTDLHNDPRFKEMMQRVRASLEEREGTAA